MNKKTLKLLVLLSLTIVFIAKTSNTFAQTKKQLCCIESPIEIEFNNSNQMLDSIIYQKTDTITNNYNTISMSLLEFNENKLLVKETDQSWINESKEYAYKNKGITNKKISTFNYDVKGNLIEELIESWDSIPEKKLNFDDPPYIRITPAFIKIGKLKTIKTYDAKGNKLTQVTIDLNKTENREGISSDTLYNFIYTYTFNEYGKITSEIVKQFIYNSWTNYSITSYNYVSLGNLSSIIEQNMDYDVEWKNWSQIIYTYNEQNKVKTELTQSWDEMNYDDPFDGKWYDVILLTNVYDLKGEKTKSNTILFDLFNTVIKNLESSFGNNSFGNPTQYSEKILINGKLFNNYQCLFYYNK